MRRVPVRLLVLASLVVTPPAGAATVVSDANVALADGAPAADYRLTVFQDAEATDPTSLLLDYDGSNLAVMGASLDEQSDLYLVFGGDAFTAQNIADGLFAALFTSADGSAGPVAVGSGDFFLGLSTGQGFDAGDPNRDVFGWVELRNTGGELGTLGSAVAYDFSSPGAPGNGILVGTDVAVPEPSTGLLVALGLVALMPRAAGRRAPGSCSTARCAMARRP